MRIRAAIAASVLAATVVLGSATTALAGGHHDHPRGHHHGCHLYAAIIHGNPVLVRSCSGDGFRGHSR
ncbi:hypothetical protein [Streptomyces sp. NPDC053427]|uniref:hypothetical protein n=1 Tax=Streptomyces sp. NPDC053427 TaxID=3365701 RepID=UPI0037D30E2A